MEVFMGSGTKIPGIIAKVCYACNLGHCIEEFFALYVIVKRNIGF